MIVSMLGNFPNCLSSLGANNNCLHVQCMQFGNKDVVFILSLQWRDK